jgi:hypothetical protein
MLSMAYFFLPNEVKEHLTKSRLRVGKRGTHLSDHEFLIRNRPYFANIIVPQVEFYLFIYVYVLTIGLFIYILNNLFLMFLMFLLLN